MDKTEKPQVIVCIVYEQVFDDFHLVDPNDFLKSVPTIKALEFIIERQNKILYSFPDVNAQGNFFCEMSCYMKNEELNRIHSFLNRNESPCIIDNQSCLLFYLLALQNGNSEERELTEVDIRNIYKAYLYCTQLWTNAQSANGSVDSSLVEISIRLDLPTIEFKLNKDFEPQIYKALKLFVLA